MAMNSDQFFVALASAFVIGTVVQRHTGNIIDGLSEVHTRLSTADGRQQLADAITSTANKLEVLNAGTVAREVTEVARAVITPQPTLTDTASITSTIAAIDKQFVAPSNLPGRFDVTPIDSRNRNRQPIHSPVPAPRLVSSDGFKSAPRPGPVFKSMTPAVVAPPNPPASTGALVLKPATTIVSNRPAPSLSTQTPAATRTVPPPPPKKVVVEASSEPDLTIDLKLPITVAAYTDVRILNNARSNAGAICGFLPENRQFASYGVMGIINGSISRSTPVSIIKIGQHRALIFIKDKTAPYNADYITGDVILLNVNSTALAAENREYSIEDLIALVEAQYNNFSYSEADTTFNQVVTAITDLMSSARRAA